MKGFMERNEELIKTTMVALKLNYREQTEDQRTILEKHRSVDIPKVKKGKRKKEKEKEKSVCSDQSYIKKDITKWVNMENTMTKK